MFGVATPPTMKSVGEACPVEVVVPPARKP